VRVINNPRFIVDINVGKLAKWLRMTGYDALLFDGDDDSRMIVIALREGRIVITKDTQIVKRGVITSGKLKAVIITTDDPELQMQEVIESLDLDCHFKPFSICLECNQLLLERSKQEVEDRVPPYVLQTQHEYVECPACHRVYWKGTHWQAMTKKLQRFKERLTTP